MKIRETKKEDKKEIDKFEKEEWDKFNRQRGYNWDEKTSSFVAIENKKIIGFVRIKIVGGAAYIDDLIIKENSRGKGIGKKLLIKIEKFSRKKNCHLIYLETTEKHQGAIKFYKKEGFKKVATLKKNKHNFDCYIFEKRLK